MLIHKFSSIIFCQLYFGGFQCDTGGKKGPEGSIISLSLSLYPSQRLLDFASNLSAPVYVCEYIKCVVVLKQVCKHIKRRVA